MACGFWSLLDNFSNNCFKEQKWINITMSKDRMTPTFEKIQAWGLGEVTRFLHRTFLPWAMRRDDFNIVYYITGINVKDFYYLVILLSPRSNTAPTWLRTSSCLLQTEINFKRSQNLSVENSLYLPNASLSFFEHY